MDRNMQQNEENKLKKSNNRFKKIGARLFFVGIVLLAITYIASIITGDVNSSPGHGTIWGIFYFYIYLFVVPPLISLGIILILIGFALEKKEVKEETGEIKRRTSKRRIIIAISLFLFLILTTNKIFGFLSEFSRNIIISTKNQYLCYTLPIISFYSKDWCLSVIAVEKKDIKICEKSSGHNKEWCLKELKKSDAETADWQTYSRAYSIRFSYPPNLKMSEGDTDYFSTIRLWNPLGDDKDTEFSFNMPYQSSATQTIQNLQKGSYTVEKEISIDGFPATQLKGISTPNTHISSRAVTAVVIQLGDKVYLITNWHAGENDEIFQKILSSVKFETECSPIDFLGYELAKAATGTIDYEFNVDLNNDGKEERARVYRDPEGCQSARPIMVKIFSGAENCPKEESSHEFAGENAILSAEFVPNFLGDGKGAVAITGISTGCGSGYTERLHFLTWQDNRFLIIEGPSVGASGCQGWPFKLDGVNGPGKKIIAVESRWASDPSDYCCGCARKLQFIIYTWDGKGYVGSAAGITKNKYSEESIDEILQKEPSVLNY